MKKIMAVLMALAAANAHARGLLGERYASVSVSASRPGEASVRAFDDTVMSGSAGVNVPLAPNWDVGVGGKFTQLKGKSGGISVDTDSTGAWVAGALHLAPAHRFDPSMSAGLGYAHTTSEATSPTRHRKVTLDETYAHMEAGAQFQFGRGFSLYPYMDYVKWLNSDDLDDNAGVGLTATQ